MAFTRPMSRMKPVKIEASAPGTSSEPACSGSSGRALAPATAAIVPPAPSSSDGTNPMNGSISRSMFAARIARAQQIGNHDALSITVTADTSATSQPN